MSVVVTGGASQLPGLPERLSTLIGLPAEPATPRSQLAIGDIRFPESEYPRLDPYLPAAVGLALGGAGVGTVVDLAPRNRKKVKSDREPGSSVLKPALAVAAGLIVVLGVPTFLAKQSLADKKSERTSVEQHNHKLEASIAAKADVAAAKERVDGLDAQLTSLLQNDVSWSHMIQDVSATMPGNVWLSSFEGQVTQPVPVAPAAPPATDGTTTDTTATDQPPVTTPVAPAPTGLQGVATFSAAGKTYDDVSAWLNTVGATSVFPAFSDSWVSSASQSEAATGVSVTFSSNAKLTDAARSHRLEKYRGGAQ